MFLSYTPYGYLFYYFYLHYFQRFTVITNSCFLITFPHLFYLLFLSNHQIQKSRYFIKVSEFIKYSPVEIFGNINLYCILSTFTLVIIPFESNFSFFSHVFNFICRFLISIQLNIYII